MSTTVSELQSCQPILLYTSVDINFKTPLLPASKHSQLKGGTSSRDAPAMLIITGSEHNLEISYRVVFGN